MYYYRLRRLTSIFLFASFIFFLAQPISAVSITHFFPVTKVSPAASASNQTTDEASDTDTAIKRLYYPTYSPGDTISILYRISHASIDNSEGHVSRVVSMYVDDYLENRFSAEHLTPTLEGESFSHWQMLDITLPDTTGICRVEVKVRDHLQDFSSQGTEQASQGTSRGTEYESINEQNRGSDAAEVFADFTCFIQDPDGTNRTDTGEINPHLLPPEQRGLGTILGQLGLQNASFSLKQNAVRIHYDEDMTSDFSTMFTKMMTAMVTAGAAYPESDTIALFPQVDGIPVFRVWAPTESIIEMASGNLTFSDFFKNSLTTDFSVYQGVFPETVDPIFTYPTYDADFLQDNSGMFCIDFFDTFDTVGSDWITDDELVIQEGSYHFTPRSNGRLSFLDQYFDNGGISLEVSKTSGSDDSGYGILFNVRDSQSFFYFMISGSGYFSVGYALHGQYTQVIPWTKTDVIIKDVPSNTLMVSIDNNTATGKINNQEVFSIGTGILTNGSVGLIATPGAEVAFDNVTVFKKNTSLGDSIGDRAPQVDAADTSIDGIAIYQPDYGQTTATAKQQTVYIPLQQDSFESVFNICISEYPVCAKALDNNLINRQMMRLAEFETLTLSADLTDQRSLLQLTANWIAAYIENADSRQISSTINKLRTAGVNISEETNAALLLNWGILLLDKDGPIQTVIYKMDDLAEPFTRLLASYAYHVLAAEITDFNFTKNRMLIQEILGIPEN